MWGFPPRFAGSFLRRFGRWGDRGEEGTHPAYPHNFPEAELSAPERKAAMKRLRDAEELENLHRTESSVRLSSRA